ncbi:MAG TPA: SHOCT domain-containing protein, partial [Actinomycetota bacterium]|nr:SHOCT domain-containing protein [Actinomycetota bacterium]
EEAGAVMWYGWGSGSWVGWLLMTLVMIVFWGGLIVLVAWAVRSLGRGAAPHRGDVPGDEAMRLLEQRFAKGEIDRDEFDERRTVLQGVRRS